MIAALIISNLITIALCVYMRAKWAQVAAYARKADQERVALAIEVGELKEEGQYISFASFDSLSRQN